MTAPNRNVLWAETLVEEFAAGGLEAACLAPGSRCTPLTVALAEHDDVTVSSHLDERSAAFFALGRGRRTGEPTAVVTTSGTAAANLHPAVIEADAGRVPLLAITADRPPVLRDSGANQTIDQVTLYGDAVRWYRELPEPAAEPRKLRRLRTDAARALGAATGTPAGPVHLNVPFEKPLEPTPVDGDVPEGWHGGDDLAVAGRNGPSVTRHEGEVRPADAAIPRLRSALAAASRPLVVAGPASPRSDPAAAGRIADALGAPVLADPLSGLRFGPATTDRTVAGGYDGWLAAVDEGPHPDVVVRTGASPTSKVLREYLRDLDVRQFLLDPAGGWREATFTASDHVAAAPSAVADALEGLDAPAAREWRERIADRERTYWGTIGEALDDPDAAALEGSVLHDVVDVLEDSATVVVSNSMPVRDLDRFGRPATTDLTVLGNRGASGIDGVVSTALGAGSATDEPLVAVLGDLAYYHDMNGLLALERCGVDATIVLLDNDGGGIFHALPIEDFDPPFTELFKTPHGLDFEPTGELYDLAFERVPPADFPERFRASVDAAGTQVLALEYDAAASHRRREAIQERVATALGDSA